MKKDDNYDIRSFVTGNHGREHEHGTFYGATVDGYITDDPDFKNVAEITLNEIVAGTTYSFDISTTTPFSYPNLYLKCTTNKQGDTKYTTLHGNDPFGMNNP